MRLQSSCHAQMVETLFGGSKIMVGGTIVIVIVDTTNKVQLAGVTSEVVALRSFQVMFWFAIQSSRLW